MSDFDATTTQMQDASLLLSPPPEANRGDWIQTFSGTAFYPADPRIDEIMLADLRHARRCFVVSADTAAISLRFSNTP